MLSFRPACSPGSGRVKSSALVLLHRSRFAARLTACPPLPVNTAPLTARAVARRELTAAIVASARRQLADIGPAQLSVRAVARDLGMASSAVYRYFPSRDELLTELLVIIYGELADLLESADAACRAGGPERSLAHPGLDPARLGGRRAARVRVAVRLTRAGLRRPGGDRRAVGPGHRGARRLWPGTSTADLGRSWYRARARSPTSARRAGVDLSDEAILRAVDGLGRPARRGQPGAVRSPAPSGDRLRRPLRAGAGPARPDPRLNADLLGFVGSARSIDRANDDPSRSVGVAGADALLLQQRAQHVLHDAAVAVVVGLTGGVDPDDGVEARRRRR